jgi:hypothetical protein
MTPPTTEHRTAVTTIPDVQTLPVPRQRGIGPVAVTLLATSSTRPARESTKDTALLSWGEELAELHQPDPEEPTRCGNPHCDPLGGYPCHGRRIADRLIDASTAGWPHCWTARLDALSCGIPLAVMPAAQPGGAGPAHRTTAGTEATSD